MSNARLNPSVGPARASGAGSERDADHTQELFREYARTRDARLRDRLVDLHHRLVHYFALRLATGPGATYDDMVQVGYIGLIAAIDRFDPDHGTTFVTFAAPTIVGVIKRYLRDHTWALKVPRRLRELGITLRKHCGELEVQLGRPATLSEIAARTGIPEERIAEALELERAYLPMSLDASRPDGADGEISTWEAIGGRDPQLDAIEEREMLRRAIEMLEERQRVIIYGRYFAEASQSQVADKLGMSQMHVSRLERQALKRLKEMLS